MAYSASDLGGQSLNPTVVVENLTVARPVFSVPEGTIPATQVQIVAARRAASSISRQTDLIRRKAIRRAGKWNGYGGPYVDVEGAGV